MNSNQEIWPLSKTLLIAILNDQIKDTFVVKLLWERLGYKRKQPRDKAPTATDETPLEWRKKFLEAPQFITQRKASVELTRSIPKQYKQLLKSQLNFPGYRIGELYPRRTRRATAVNWLLSWVLINNETLPENGPCPTLLPTPLDPVQGHPGDPPIE